VCQKYDNLWILYYGLGSNIAIKIIIGVLRFIILMKLLKCIFAYYKPLFLWSFTINLLVLMASNSFLLTILTKVFLMTLGWLLLKDCSVRKKIGFYKIAGISNLRLLCFLFIIDCFVSIPFLFLVKGFT